MTLEYDAQADILRMIFKDIPIEESDEEQPGLIVDYDTEGNVVGVELLDAGKRIVSATKPRDLQSHLRNLQKNAVRYSRKTLTKSSLRAASRRDS
ncbi:MAG: DUF2283 domain-containing protein [Anaerolineae bacterium]|nr:DUF2283 domain-containing protein [Anaerolineae bacterium]